MDQKDTLNTIFHHHESFKEEPLKHPQMDCSSFRSMIYDNIRKLDQKSLDIKTIKRLIEVLEIWRNKAAQMDCPRDQEHFRDQMIKLAEEQLLRFEKIVKNDSDKTERLRKQKYDKKRFIWQIVGIILAVVFSVAGLVVGIISLCR